MDNFTWIVDIVISDNYYLFNETNNAPEGKNMKLTANQKKGLIAARDQGNAWRAWGMKWTASVDRTLNTLVREGLLSRDHRTVTEKGLAEIA